MIRKRKGRKVQYDIPSCGGVRDDGEFIATSVGRSVHLLHGGQSGLSSVFLVDLPFPLTVDDEVALYNYAGNPPNPQIPN